MPAGEVVKFEGAIGGSLLHRASMDLPDGGPLPTADEAAAAVRVLLAYAGEDPDRPGLRDTPRRVLEMYQELLSGARSEPPVMTCFAGSEIGTALDQMIVVRDLPVASMCEHHLLPFFGKAHVGYLPQAQLLGLSKFARVVAWLARRPQTQERLTGGIAEFLFNAEAFKPRGVIAVVEATHTCLAIRGARAPGHATVTCAIRGDMDKGEFFSHLTLRGA